MKSFNIIRYLKKWWPLIALMSFCAGVFFMRYATSNQSYTAQSIIKYNYSKAEDGKTPSGEDLDVSEIFSSTVVKEAIENLGLTVNVDTIRSGGTVTGIVPDDVTKTQEAKIDKGEDVEEYHSTEYIVKLSVSSEYSTEYVRTMLDEILSCYFANFGEKYVDYSTIPNNAAALDGQGYDYIEQAEILNDTVAEITANLGNCQAAHPEFVSSTTGLSLSDLLDEYNYVSDVEIPYLFSEILGGKLTQNREVLLKKYQERYNTYVMDGDVDSEKVAAVLEVIQSYGNKNKDGSLYYQRGARSGTDDDTGGFVLSDVYEEDTNIDRTTVYDNLISDYVTILNRQSNNVIDAAYCQYIINVFQGASDSSDVSDENQAFTDQAVEQEIAALQGRLNTLYETLSLTMKEYNEYCGAVNLGVLASTTVSEKINVKLYILLGVAVFFILGICGAILLGRIQDFVEYLFFTEQSLDMPNRTACDLFIRNNSSRVLPDDTVCVVVELANLSQINTVYGRERGNAMLTQFADFLKEASATCGTIYYNGGQQFIGFFDQCRMEDAESFADYFHRLIAAYNAESTEATYQYVIGISESKANNAYSIRALLREALRSKTRQEG
mgnify:FL=1